MSRIVHAEVQWIPEECGGEGALPVGLRSSVRWQRNVRNGQTAAWDATIVDVTPESDTRAHVQLTFMPHYSIDSDYLVEGELIELLEGYRVVGVGQIRN
jgi:hypothetical protein